MRPRMNNNPVFINNVLIASYFTKYIAKNDYDNYYDSFYGFNDRGISKKSLQSILPEKIPLENESYD